MADRIKLTKNERRMLKHHAKKEQREKNLLYVKQKEKANKLIIPIIAGVIIIVLAAITFSWYSSLQDAPIIKLSSNNYDFGTVSQAKGTVSGSITVKNEGIKDLIISNIVSSCGCTSATLIVDDTESPVFGMHSSYPGWSQTLAPGQSAELKIRYDPNVHMELRGNLTRNLRIYSNSAIESIKMLTITAYQTD